MHIRIPKPWELPESSATSESDYLNRRKFIKTLGLGAGLLASGAAGQAATAGFPSKLNAGYKGEDLEKTPYDLITGYNNFY